MVRKQLEKWLGKDTGEKIAYIQMAKIHPNPYQPRQVFSEQELRELAQSIRSFGLIQPIVVREVGEEFQIVAGERRYKACCLLGFSEIPALVQDIDDQKAAAIALIENLQRKDLNYFEEGRAYHTLMAVFGMTQEELARKVGRSQSAIANKIRLLKLPREVQECISTDVVTERHARTLLRLSSCELQKEIIRQIYEQELTVKETEALVEKLSRNDIPREIIGHENGQQISMVIRDTRIFLNTIKETVKRARQTGVDIFMFENEKDSEYEIVIRVNKKPKQLRCAVK
jgi:ParB family chromosome partitioning protein